MSSNSTLNDQIIDSVATVDFLNIGSSPASAQAMLDAVMSETLGMAMHNAVMRQQANSLVSSAATTATCARMLQSPLPRPHNPTPAPPAPPAPPPPASPYSKIPPLDSPPPPITEADLRSAEARANSAIDSLQAQAQVHAQKANLAQSLLAKLRGERPCNPTPPAPASTDTGNT